MPSDPCGPTKPNPGRGHSIRQRHQHLSLGDSFLLQPFILLHQTLHQLLAVIVIRLLFPAMVLCIVIVYSDLIRGEKIEGVMARMVLVVLILMLTICSSFV